MSRLRLLPLLVVVLVSLAGVPLAAQVPVGAERQAVEEATRLARIAPEVRVVLIHPALAPDVDAELVAAGVVPGADGRRYLRVLATEARSHEAGVQRP